MTQSKIKSFYILDLTRFIAALAVIIYHYRHFYYEAGMKPTSFDQTIQPFYQFIPHVYDYGFYAVQYFWILSGFVFHYTYFNKMSLGQVSASKYAINRIARLYPLHLASLIIVMILTSIHFEIYDFYFVYQSNDAKHFLLNIFMISNWGFEDSESFNGPIWSVSVEIFSYICFFLFATYIKGNNYLVFIVISITSIVLFKLTSINLFYGLFCFYLGGIVHLLYISLTQGALKALLTNNFFWVIVIALLLPALLTLTLIQNKNIFILNLLCIFSLSILVFAIIQFKLPESCSSVGLLGDISYSIYLIHFPLQLLIATFFSSYFEVDSPTYFFIYIFITIIMSLYIHKYFEMPSKSLIKKSLKSKVNQKEELV